MRAAFLLLSLLAACTASNTVASPPGRSPDDWPVRTAEQAGLNADALAAVIGRISRGSSYIHAVLVEREGYLVAELYRTGEDRVLARRYGVLSTTTEFGPDTLHDVRSISKSVISLLYGMAMERGKAPLPESPVSASLPGLKGLDNAGVIQIRHLLTMSTGLAWDEIGHGDLTSDEFRLFWKADRLAYVFDRPLANTPGTTFNYNGGATVALAEILSDAAHRSFVDIAAEDLFRPLGITQWEWATDFRGRPLPFGGLRLRPRDMLKIGRLILNRGRWNNRQLVPAEWIDASIQTHKNTGLHFFTGAGQEAGYGFQWWTGTTILPGRQIGWAAAIGNGGQRITVIPELNMTVVVTAGDYGSPEIQTTVARLIDEIIVATLRPPSSRELSR